MIRRILKKLLVFLKNFSWLVSALLLWASFPPMGEKLDSFFALAPMIFLSRQGDAKKSAIVWGVNGLAFWIATLAWMVAIVKNGGPWPLVVLGWFALSLYLSLYFASFGWLNAKLWRWVRLGGYYRRLLAILFAEPILWAGLEIVRANFGGGFAWNQLGIPAINAGFSAPARIGGVALVSALVFLVNGTFASIAERVVAPLFKGRFQVNVPRAVRSIETILPVLLIWLIFSISNPKLSARSNEAKTITIAMIQRNFPCTFKSQEENPIKVYEKLIDEIAMWRPDLVMMSESAMSEFGDVNSQNAQYFADYCAMRANAASILAGGSRVDREDNLYNSAALYISKRAMQEGASSRKRDIDSLQIYDKVHLVPFGEFIPLDKTFPWLKRFAPVGSCSSGVEKVLTLPDGTNFGCGICYEDTDSGLIRRVRLDGAKFFAFITNDSWFSESVEAQQHAWQAVARAVETGVPIVRVGNSGVTGVVLPEGEISWLSDEKGNPIVDKQATMVTRLTLGTYAMPAYVKLGDAPLSWAFAILMLIMLATKLSGFIQFRN